MSQRLSPIELRLHAKQGVALETGATEVLYGGAVGGGKALALDTPIATPFGWSAMGEISIGDTVFDERGQPCRVVAATPIMTGRPCYRVRFSDGAEIVADANHQWLTFDVAERSAALRLTSEWRERRRAKRGSRAKEFSQKPWVSHTVTLLNQQRQHEYKDLPTGNIRTTEEIARTLRYGAHGRGINHSVDVSGPLDCAVAALPIDPYVLGAWLGDGDSSQAAITSADTEIVEAIAACGYNIRKRTETYAYGIPGGMLTHLRTLSLINNKHIPNIYLRASQEQRLALLQGLMDTDGHANDRGQCEFCVTRRQLVDDVAELVSSLGIKCAITESHATLNGRYISPKYTIKFMTEKPAFRMARKLIRQKRGGFRGTHSRRYIEACDPIESVPVRCIEVDSPSHLFLAGRQMIPTHNSHLMRAAAIMWCGMIPGLQVYLFRRLRADLVKNHIEGPSGFRALLAPWVRDGLCEMVEDEIRFWNGAKIYLCHCKDEKDRFNYLGSEIHVLLIDELTTFTDRIYRFLRSRVRMAGVVVPDQFNGLFPRILCSSNPGNVGHHFVKAAFIDPRPMMEIERMAPSEGGMLRQFIPARLNDNPSVDPTDYGNKVEGLGSPELVRAMKDGDWNVVAGAFFPEFSTDLHVIAPRPLPRYWQRYRSFDWGSARPFSVGWYAVSDGELPDLPRGALIRYREWYGAARDKQGLVVPNTGLRLTAEEVADGIVEREKDDAYGNRLMGGVADPSIFAENGGPSIATRMAGRKCSFRAADNTRVGGLGAVSGWDHVRSRLKGDGEVPTLFFFSTCTEAIRTFPALQHDDGRPEDIDTDAEDHVADEIRYACAARPYTAPLPPSADAPEPDRYARTWRPRRAKGSSMAA